MANHFCKALAVNEIKLCCSALCSRGVVRNYRQRASYLWEVVLVVERRVPDMDLHSCQEEPRKPGKHKLLYFLVQNGLQQFEL